MVSTAVNGLKLANQLEGSKTLKVLLHPYYMQHTCIYTHINKILIKLMYNWIIFAQMFVILGLYMYMKCSIQFCSLNSILFCNR